MPLSLQSYAESHKPALAERLRADDLLDPDSAVGRFWIDLLEAPYRANSDVVLALDGGRVDGVAVANRRPYGREEGRATHIFVTAAKRRHGIGTALKEALDQRLAARGIARQYTVIYRDLAAVRPFLTATGFTLVSEDIVAGWNGKLHAYSPVEGLRCALYRGGDPRLDEQIADLQNRAFRREPIVPHVTAEAIDHLLTVEGHWMLVATEEASGEVVAVTECTDTPFYPSIAVARRYWASGLADWIAGLSLERYAAAGITNPWTVVRQRNQASLALLKRVNWHELDRCYTFTAPTGA